MIEKKTIKQLFLDAVSFGCHDILLMTETRES